MYGHRTEVQWVAAIDHDMALDRQFGWGSQEHLLERNVHRLLLVTFAEGFPIPNVEEQIERGEFSELHLWLRENIYSLGRKLTPAETVERVVGGPIDPQPYLAYLRDKLA